MCLISDRAIAQEPKDAVRHLDRGGAEVMEHWTVVWAGDGYDGQTNGRCGEPGRGHQPVNVNVNVNVEG